LNNRIRLIILAAVTAVHIALLVLVRFGSGGGAISALGETADTAGGGIMRLVNIQPPAPAAAVPPPEPIIALPPAPAPIPAVLAPAEVAPQTAELQTSAEVRHPADARHPSDVEAAAEREAALDSLETGNGGGFAGSEYFRLHEISTPPLLPVNQITRNVVYPPVARQMNIEGIARLELFINRQGNITAVRVLSETPPNRGFGAAAADAFRGVRALRPAELNGVPVAVRFQYNLTFALR